MLSPEDAQLAAYVEDPPFVVKGFRSITKRLAHLFGGTWTYDGVCTWHRNDDKYYVARTSSGVDEFDNPLGPGYLCLYGVDQPPQNVDLLVKGHDHYHGFDTDRCKLLQDLWYDPKLESLITAFGQAMALQALCHEGDREVAQARQNLIRYVQLAVHKWPFQSQSSKSALPSPGRSRSGSSTVQLTADSDDGPASSGSSDSPSGSGPASKPDSGEPSTSAVSTPSGGSEDSGISG